MHLLDLFPELHHMIRVKLDLYSAAALDMTCHFFWDSPAGLPMHILLHFGRDEQATQVQSDGFCRKSLKNINV